VWQGNLPHRISEEIMIKFGNYALITPVTHQFEKEPDLFWIINPPTSGDELAVSQFLSFDRMIMTPDGTRISRAAVNLEIAYREIALTFGGTNIEDEDGKPVLTKESTVEEIEKVLRLMPHAMVMEIWQTIGDTIPLWGPSKPKVLNPKN
jgi:hypothetical protein